VPGGFLAPAAGGGVGGEGFGVGALQLQPGGHDAPVPNSTPSVSGRYPAAGGGAVALAATDPHRAARLSADAERIAQSITIEYWKAQVLAGVAEALAAIDPDRATRILADAERIAQSITSENLKIVALVKIAEAWNQG